MPAATTASLGFSAQRDNHQGYDWGGFNTREDGAFYQFTYGWRCPVPAAVRRQLDLQATHLGRVWRNLPPAAVWRIERRQW